MLACIKLGVVSFLHRKQDDPFPAALNGAYPYVNLK
jgi:hypothetical protein